MGRDNTVVDQSCEGFPPFPPPDTKDSDCGGDGECVTLGDNNIVDRTIDCGKVPPCLLEVEKFCSVPPPLSADLECDAKIAATTLMYIGPNILDATVVFSGKNKKSDGSVRYEGVDLIPGVTVLTSPAENGFTIDDRPEDLGSKMTIAINGVEEVIHTSCSTPYVVGQPAPLDNPKGDPSPNWFVVNFVDKEGDFSGMPDSGQSDLFEKCDVVGVKPGSCEDGKPTALVFEYTGENCSVTTNDQEGKFKCAETGPLGDLVNVVMTKDAGKISVSINGNRVTIFYSDPMGKKLPSEIQYKIIGTTGEQSQALHTSCSKPLNVGDRFGGLILREFIPRASPCRVKTWCIPTASRTPV